VRCVLLDAFYSVRCSVSRCTLAALVLDAQAVFAVKTRYCDALAWESSPKLCRLAI
jgi:hypothetical protein